MGTIDLTQSVNPKTQMIQCSIYPNTNTKIYINNNITIVILQQTHCPCVLDKLQRDPNENQAPKACLGFLS